jgi:TrmH family RNA methyltransferase
MPVRIVQSKQNSRLKELRRALASPGRDGNELVGIEGPHLLSEAVRAGLKIHCVFAAQGAEALLDRLSLPSDSEVLLFPADILAGALATETPQPLAALVQVPAWTWSRLLDGDRKTEPLVLVVAGLQDPGNLGTIIRSAEAFAANGIVCLPRTVSPWNPKTMRASAGSVFRVPIVTGLTPDSLARLRKAGLKTYSATAHAARPVHLANLAGPVALVIGNEGRGVPQDLVAQADGAVTIPCPGPVESLNAAVAASVLLYEASRQRALPSSVPPKPRGGTQ